jgi:heat shock protein HtpX
MSEVDSTKIEKKYTINTEVNMGNLKNLPEFLRRNYLLQHKKYRNFKEIKMNIGNNTPSLTYKVVIPKTKSYIDVTVEATVPIKVRFRYNESAVTKIFINQLYEDLFLIIQLFEDEIRKTTLYLAFMPGEKIVAEKESKGLIGRIFTESMLPLYVILTTFTLVFFVIFGDYGPIVFVVLSFTLSIFSGKIVSRIGHWTITQNRQEIFLLQYHFSPDKFENFRKKYVKNISKIRKRIYNNSIAVGKLPDCKLSSEIFSEYGIDCTKENFSVKKINVYHLIKKAAERFSLSIPRIVVTNNIIPNAAAAGPAASLGTVMITTGILTQLEENELLNVIGHEMSHLKAHDPLIMSSLSSLEFLFRFYIIFPYIAAFGFIFFWIYFIIAIGLIYFFGKFLEGRADLDSAKLIGQPKVLAKALKKIGFRRLFPLYKREPEFKEYRRSEWFRFDPHPPVYHRISQLEKLKNAEKIQHTFFRTVKDNIKAFINA